MKDNALEYWQYMKLVDDTLCFDGKCCRGLDKCPYKDRNCDVKEYGRRHDYKTTL